MYCGGAAEPDLADYRPPRCAGCDGQMEAHPDHDKAVAHCQRCDSLWFGRGVLEAILAKVELHVQPAPMGQEPSVLPVRVPQPVEYRQCPSCAQHMARSNYGRISGVIIDTCRRHGTYLDAGELEALEVFVQSGGMEAAEKHERMETLSLEEAALREKKRRERWAAIARGRASAHDFIYDPRWFENPLWTPWL